MGNLTTERLQIPDADGIELIKAAGDGMVKEITALCNKI